MAKIIAVGKLLGVGVEVVCVDRHDRISLLFDGERDYPMEEQFRFELRARHPMGGTFYPPENSMLNALNVLKYYFFDDEPKITVVGDIGQIPGEGETVY